MFVYGNAIWVDVNSDYYEDADPEIVIDIRAINNSLFNLFSCPIGSRPFQRDYGCQLIAYQMEPSDQTTADDLKFSLFQSIAKWEPRIIIDKNATSVVSAFDGAGFDINLFYSVSKTLTRARYQYNARRAAT